MSSRGNASRKGSGKHQRERFTIMSEFVAVFGIVFAVIAFCIVTEFVEMGFEKLDARKQLLRYQRAALRAESDMMVE